MSSENESNPRRSDKHLMAQAPEDTICVKQEDQAAPYSSGSTLQISSSAPKTTRIEASQVATEFQNDKGSSEMDMDLAPWKGWAELENDPIIFTTILREWGVQNVQVDEVIPLDAILEKDPSSVLGLIFLSRWAAAETVNEATGFPMGLWFANQISTFSCATLALMNIINNQNNISLGAELQDFKTNTLAMSPKERGMQLDDFQFIKDIHNSFSRELDRMNVDLQLKDEAQAAAKKSKKSKKKFTKRKKRRHPDEDNEPGLHFVAYVPAQGRLWRLDGMESHPRDMGRIEIGETWLVKIIVDLQMVLQASEENGTEFSLLSLNHEPGNKQSYRDDPQVSRMKEDWSPFIAHMLRLHADKGDISDLLR